MNINNHTHLYNFKKKINPSKFTTTQPEDDVVKSFYSNSYNLKTTSNEYKCQFIDAEITDYQKPHILLCIKDNAELLQFTLNNMKQNKIFDFANVLIIDDRSETDHIKTIALESDCSYMRVDNTANQFNFSMLHNLATHALKTKSPNLKDIILWSSDLWTNNPEVLPTLYRKHTENKNTITGTKLLYPTKNFLYHKPDRADKVQYAGSMFGPRPNEVGLFALHMFRGYPKDDPKVNCDKGELFITGAFLIIDAEWYIKTGGFCPSLKASYQDVDLCLRANEQNRRVMYYGEELYLYHYENLTLDATKEDLKKVQLSDTLWYKGFWEPQRIKNLLYVNET